MQIKKSSKQWAESRGAVLVGTPLKPNHDAERFYRVTLQKAIERMRKDYEQALRKELKPAIKAAAMDMSLGAQLGFMFGSLDDKWGKFFGKLARSLAGRVVNRINQTSKRNLDASLKDLSGGLTIKTPKMPAAMLSELQAATRVNVGLIKSIQSQYHEKVFQAVMNNVGDAESIKGAAEKLVSQTYHIGETVSERAAFIARDQTAKLTTATNASRMKSAGVTRFRWRHSGGSADPRKLHLGYDGQEFDIDDPPVIDERTGERGLPGQAINCHPGDSVIKVLDSCNKLYRSWYTGELITLVSDDDIILQATPNHPILTERGWVPIKFINERDKLVNSKNHRVNIGKNDVYNVETRLDELFSSAARYIGIKSTAVSGTGLELHGDITDSYIDIVDMDGPLMDWIKPEAAKNVIQLLLTSSNVVLTHPCGFSANSSVYALINAVTAAPQSVISGLCSLAAVIESGSSCADNIRLALISNIDFVISKYPSNCASSDIEFLRHLELADARDVSFNDFVFGKIIQLARRAFPNNERDSIGAEMLGEIVRVDAKNISNSLEGSLPVEKGSSAIKKISSEYFSGHVYNLETSSNWYDCNGIISHNCKCYMIPIIDFGE